MSRLEPIQQYRRLSLLKIDLRRLNIQQHEQLNIEQIENINLESDPKKFFPKVHTPEVKEALFILGNTGPMFFQEDSDIEDFDEDHIY